MFSMRNDLHKSPKFKKIALICLALYIAGVCYLLSKWSTFA